MMMHGARRAVTSRHSTAVILVYYCSLFPCQTAVYVGSASWHLSSTDQTSRGHSHRAVQMRFDVESKTRTLWRPKDVIVYKLLLLLLSLPTRLGPAAPAVAAGLQRLHGAPNEWDFFSKLFFSFAVNTILRCRDRPNDNSYRGWGGGGAKSLNMVLVVVVVVVVSLY